MNQNFENFFTKISSWTKKSNCFPHKILTRVFYKNLLFFEDFPRIKIKKHLHLFQFTFSGKVGLYHLINLFSQNFNRVFQLGLMFALLLSFLFQMKNGKANKTSRNFEMDTIFEEVYDSDLLEVTDTDEYEHLGRLIDFFFEKMENKLWYCNDFGKENIREFRRSFSESDCIPLIREKTEFEVLNILINIQNSLAIKNFKEKVLEVLTNFFFRFNENCCESLTGNQLSKTLNLSGSIEVNLVLITNCYIKSLYRENIECFASSPDRISKLGAGLFPIIEDYREAKSATIEEKNRHITKIYEQFDEKIE